MQTSEHPSELGSTSAGPESKKGCELCRHPADLPIAITMAFQPIVDPAKREVYAHEALVRGKQGQGAYEVLSKIDATNRYTFDQACRVTAIELAAKLNVTAKLSINFLPNAIYRPETCIRATLNAAAHYGFDTSKLMFEVTEGEKVSDSAHLRSIFAEYKRQGFTTAIDDFGAGHSGLNILADFQPDVIKLDMALTRDIDKDPVRRAIVTAVMTMCRDLGIETVAEGIETADEFHALQDIGIELFQGYYFAKPAFEALATLGPRWWE